MRGEMNVTDDLSLLTAVFDPFEWEWRILTLIHVVICIFFGRKHTRTPILLTPLPCKSFFSLSSAFAFQLTLLSSSFCAIIITAEVLMLDHSYF